MAKRRVLIKTTNSLAQVGKIRAVPITDRTAYLSGSYGNSFLHLSGDNSVILIDPSVTKKFMFEVYFQSSFEKITNIYSSIVGNGDITEFLGIYENRIKFLQALIDGQIMVFNGMPINEETTSLFSERGKSIAEFFYSNNLNLIMVLATHHHIDHLGSARIIALQDDFKDVSILVPEPYFYNMPKLNIGTHPLQSPDSILREYSKYHIKLLEKIYGIKILDISGHTNMSGILLPDGCLIVGDLVAPKSALDKIGMIYLEDYASHLVSLESLNTIPFEYLLVGHSSSHYFEKQHAKLLIELNLSRALSIKEKVRRSLEENGGDVLQTTDELIGKVEDPLDRMRKMVTLFRSISSCAEMFKQ